MSLSKEQLQIVSTSLDRAESRFEAAIRTAHRTDTLQAEYDNAFEGIGNGVNFVVEAVLLAKSGRRRTVGEGEAATLIRSVVGDIRAARTNPPEAEDLIWINHQRNTSAHDGGWMSVIDVDELEEAAALGQRFAAAARAYLAAAAKAA